MSGEFLSQDEVDALLKGVAGEKDEAAEAPPAAGPRPYDLAKQERIVRGRMPTLDVVNERFARLLRIGLFNFMRRSPEISVGPVKVQKYSEFVRNLVVPANLNVVSLKPLRGSGLVVMEPALVFAVIDNLFGGDGRFHTRVEGRDFTQTEMRIIHRMLAVVLEELRTAWAPVHAIRFEHVRSEMHAQFANVATPSEVVVTTAFEVELGGGAGSLHVCIPYASVEPIRDLLYGGVQPDSAEPDRRWMRLLQKQVQSAEVELVTHLARKDVTIKQVLALRAGDFIPLDLPETAVAEVDGVPVFDCKYGTLNGQYAIRVERLLALERREDFPGESHG
jgi:flagellar motor switch protein FliM